MAIVATTKHQLKDGTPIEIRSARVEDAEELLYLAKNVFSTSEYTLTEPKDFTVSVQQERSWIESFVQPVGKVLLLAVGEGGVLVGMIDFQNGDRRKNSHSGVLGMGVRDGWRSKGVGKLLLQSLIHWAENNPHIERMELGVFEPNAVARDLYKSLGFKEEGRKVKLAKMIDGSYVDEILMSRFV